MPKKKDSGQRGWRATITRALAGGLTERIHLIELLREAHKRELIDTDTFAMLEGALSVADQQVRDIMVPRARMVCIRRDDPLTRILPAVVEAGHSRYPVVDGDRDDVVGILLAKDLLRATNGAASRLLLVEFLVG
jgi:magnesium and cobalt transporter